MTKPRKQVIPKLADMTPAELAATEQALEMAKAGSMAHLTLDDFIMNDPEEEVVKGQQHDSGGWLHSPAHLEMFKAADRRLAKVAEERGMSDKLVEGIRASLLKGQKKVFFWPAEDNDLSAIPVKRYGSAAWFNLVTLLSQAKLNVRTGYRERFDIEFAPNDCPLYPCLMMDLGKVLERRKDTTAKPPESGATAGQPAKPRKGKKASAPEAPTSTAAPDAAGNAPT